MDTRALTKKIREQGTMLGQLICSKSVNDTGQNGFYDPNISNLVKEVSCKVRLKFLTLTHSYMHTHIHTHSLPF